MMTPSLCENCHKRPKFGTHRFCGKTCAAQAAAAKPQAGWGIPSWAKPQGKAGPRNQGKQRAAPAPQKAAQPLCIYCGQKPKFNGFDYCGKSCAAKAGATHTQAKPPAAHRVPAMIPKTTYPSSAPATRAPAPSTAKPHRAPQAVVPVTQLADSAEEDKELEDDEDDGDFTDLDDYPPESEPESEDAQSVPVATSPPKAGVKNTSRGGKASGTAQRIAPGVCGIPGCGQPSYIDRNGVKTKYCSERHREEAVKRNLEPACIMCQQYPQSDSDYFCSSGCRNQSMTKT